MPPTLSVFDLPEPDWAALPFPTFRDEWKGFASAPTIEALKDAISVWIEEAAIRAFALATEVDQAEAATTMWFGVERWREKGMPAIDADGRPRSLRSGEGLKNLRLVGAPRLTLELLHFDRFILVFLPR